MSKLKTIIAKDKEHLKILIKQNIKNIGFKCDLNHIDVSQINDMSNLFEGSRFNGDISKWNVSNVTDMAGMFKGSFFNGEISKWNVSNVTNMKSMFGYSPFSSDISNWNTSNVANMKDMFKWSQFNGNISNWNINDDCDIEHMFLNAQYPDNGILYWYFAYIGEIKEIDDIKAAHIEKFKPILDGMGLDGVRAARFLHQTYTNQNLDIPMHDIGL